MNIIPVLLSDAYKYGHTKQYPPNTTLVYSNTTPRKSRLENVDSVVVFGIQYFVKEYLINLWNKEFFNRNIDDVIRECRYIIDNSLGPDVIQEDQLKYLHSLGHLPIKIKALPEEKKKSLAN